jgi:hypothetical protein
VEDRLSVLQDKIDVKIETEEFLVKQFKSCERNMQELSESIKEPNPKIMGTEEGEEV